MLRAGASLPEIGQILRHREQKTTAIYLEFRSLLAGRDRCQSWRLGPA
jgi:hypothetical protein